MLAGPLTATGTSAVPTSKGSMGAKVSCPPLAMRTPGSLDSTVAVVAVSVSAPVLYSFTRSRPRSP